jgi:hypothetical protein
MRRPVHPPSRGRSDRMVGFRADRGERALPDVAESLSPLTLTPRREP